MDHSEGNWIVKTQKCARYWKAEIRIPDKKDENDGHVIEYGQLIAVFYGKNTVGNARLASAAPNIYLRLVEMNNMLEKLLIEYPLASLNEPLLQAINDNKQALAKAEGKDS